MFNEGVVLENERPDEDSQQRVEERPNTRFEVEQIIYKSSEDDGNSEYSIADQEESKETQTQHQQ